MRKDILNSSQRIVSINFGKTTSLIQTGNAISFKNNLLRLYRTTRGMNINVKITQENTSVSESLSSQHLSFSRFRA